MQKAIEIIDGYISSLLKATVIEKLKIDFTIATLRAIRNDLIIEQHDDINDEPDTTEYLTDQELIERNFSNRDEYEEWMKENDAIGRYAAHG